MKFDVRRLTEPQLEFGAGVDTRVKEGLTAGGPYSLQLGARHPGQIRLGLVGPADDIRQMKEFLKRMSTFTPSLGDLEIQRPSFPGFNSTFQSDLQLDESWEHTISDDRLNDALADPAQISFGRTLRLWTEGLEELSQRDPPPDVILCAIPKAVIDHCGTVNFGERDEKRWQAPTLFDDPSTIEATTGPTGLLDRDFRRALKASAMRVALPIQIVTPNLYGTRPERYDDPASRAWNLSVALFYKAGGAPWRLADPDVDTLYIGISFHHRWHVEGHSMYAGLAQAFYPGSEGFALRGGEAQKDPDDRRLCLARSEMADLIEKVLDHYTMRTSRDPRRVVVHKTTAFDSDEIAGARDALDNVPATDFVALRSSSFRLLRQGDYPPQRGTLAQLGERAFLLTTGFQTNRGTYKGSHIPVPLDLVTDAPRERAASDVMALTKLNWNSAGDHTQFPVTLAFAQKVGTIMAEVPEDQDPQTRFSFYI